jgi:hypothetical protein
VLLTRRALLGGLAALAAVLPLAGCSTGQDAGPSASPTPDPDEVARRAVAAAESQLAALAAWTVTAFPALATRVTPAQQAHEAHANELLAGLPTATPSATTSGSPPVTSSAAPVVPASPAAALAALTTAQTAAATAATARLGTVTGDLARLLASVAASDAALAALMRTPGAVT